MTAALHLMSQTVVGLLVCAGLACGLSFMGDKVYEGVEEEGSRLAVGHCRQCGQLIRFAPQQWCASCRWCGQLTNVDQSAPPKHPPQVPGFPADTSEVDVATVAAATDVALDQLVMDLPTNRGGL